ncbi:MAG: hypothetical protein WDN66_00520 [Candidatus Saccharibacteria bacterium]
MSSMEARGQQVQPTLSLDQGSALFNLRVELNPSLMDTIVNISGGNPGTMQAIFSTMSEAVAVGHVQESDITPTILKEYLNVPENSDNLDSWQQIFRYNPQPRQI